MTHSITNPLGRRSFLAGSAIVTASAALLPGSEALAATQPTFPAFSTSRDGLTWFATLPGEEMAIHVPSELVDGRFTTLESIATAGAGVPPHIHNGADEYFFIQEGQLHFVCDGVAFDAAAGTSVVIPRGVAHSWANLTDKPVRSLVTFTPGGIEDMFTQLAAAFPEGLETLAAQFDTYLVKS